MIAEPGVYDIDDATYHADPVAGGSLSCTGAKKLLPPSCPALYKWWRENPEEHKPVWDFGKAAHQLVLGKGPTIRVVDADSWRTNAAKQARDDAHAAGEVPLLTDAYAQVEEMARALRSHRLASKLLDPDRGKVEQSLVWQDDRTGVWLRARLDYLPLPGGRLIIVDYKTAVSAEPGAFSRSAAGFGYHMQDANYRAAVKAVGLHDDPQFVFVAQEKTPPYVVSTIQLGLNAQRIGAGLMRRAIDTYHECTTSDSWPTFTDDEVALVELPVWYEREHEEYL